MNRTPLSRVVVLTGETQPALPTLDGIADRARITVVATLDELRLALNGADTLFLWDFRTPHLRDAWSAATRLEWIHAASAGVDALLFEELASSDVMVTNSSGVFDEPIAEWVLAAMLALAKDLPETLELQRQGVWQHREPERLRGSTAVVVGVGGIGRATARLLRAVGVDVLCVARTARTDPEFGFVVGRVDLPDALSQADWVVLAVPLTPETEGMIDAPMLSRMRPSARLINVARGRLVDEAALINALRSGGLKGAALDVFTSEPLGAGSPLWAMANVIVSPHMSGDVVGWKDEVAALFMENFERRLRGEPLLNLVDKQTGQLQR